MKINLHSPEILSSISLEKAEGSCLNLALQCFSRLSSANMTLSGSSSLVSAARESMALASLISVSAAVVDDVEWR